MILFFIGWLVCSFLCYGISFADQQALSKRLGGETYAREAYREDMALSISVGLLFGYVGLIMVLFVTGLGKEGFKIK